MKFILAVSAIFLAAVVLMTEARPEEEIPRPSTFESLYVPSVPVRANRQRRVTCDLLSFDTKWGSINHAACAAHCLAMLKGFRGGHCDSNGVCVCRR